MLHPLTGLHPIRTTQKKIFKNLNMATVDHSTKLMVLLSVGLHMSQTQEAGPNRGMEIEE